MIKLNLGRNCLRYLLRAYKVENIYLPYYSCNVLWQACRNENCFVRFYHIDKDFLPVEKFEKNSFILYINYFGMCDKNCEYLAKLYPNLIIDNTQAFYSKSRGLASFNSLRKFFRVQNGAYLYSNKILNQNFEEDNNLFIPVSMQEDYENFLKNELLLDKQDIKLISPEVEIMMKKFDYENDKKLRLDRFWKYHKKYEKYNSISLTPSEGEIPYCYPLSTTDINIQNEIKNINIQFLRLWDKIPTEYVEHGFLNNTVALPL